MGDEVISEEVWREILDEFDLNKDGKVFISFFL